MPITPEMIKEAYERTGLMPLRNAWMRRRKAEYQQILKKEDLWSCCPMTVLIIDKNGSVSIGMRIYFLVKELGESRAYIQGFINWWDAQRHVHHAFTDVQEKDDYLKGQGDAMALVADLKERGIKIWE